MSPRHNWFHFVWLQAVDEDERKAITYTIRQGDTGRFKLDESNGRLTTNSKLDYEKQKTYTLVVSTREASGQTNPQYSATVSIKVIDQNDFIPTFTKTSYTAPNLMETAPPGTQVVSVKADDSDPEVRVYCVYNVWYVKFIFSKIYMHLWLLGVSESFTENKYICVKMLFSCVSLFKQLLS